jgi:hypothetical protein
MALGDDIVATAREGRGRCESAGLVSPYTDAVGRQAWCGSFVEYCYRANGVHLKNYTSNPYYVSTFWADMKKRGFALDVTQSAPGDAIFYNWDGGREDHVEIVVSNNGNGSVVVIGGNVGNCVKEQTRNSKIVGVARVPELGAGGTGGPEDPPGAPPPPVGMDYGIYYDSADLNTRLYEGGVQYCPHDGVLGWNTSAMAKPTGPSKYKLQIWTQRGNYCLDLVSVVWDFAGKPNPD